MKMKWMLLSVALTAPLTVATVQAKDWTQEPLVVVQKAAEQGNAGAQFRLGVMYSKGEGVPEDNKQAFHWYTKAAEQGYAKAQFILGSMFYFGRGVAQDYDQALAWYQKAAAQGYAGAQFILGAMYDQGEGVAQNYSQALAWYQKAAAQGDAGAQFSLGNMYYNGEGVAQNYSQAFAWYQKAAAQGDVGAQNNLGVMYNQGQGVTRDYNQAFAWSKRAAEQGYADAQHNLGVMYDQGQGVTRDYSQAFAWYKRAAEQGYAKAQHNLGVMYKYGQAVAQNNIQAYVWYSVAAANGELGAAKKRDEVAKLIIPAALGDAQRLATQYFEQYQPNSLSTAASARAEAKKSSEKGNFSDQQICIATVAATMGRDPSIIKIDSIQGDITYLSYFRSDDGKHWKYKCKLDGKRAMWAADTGRWRTGQYDSKITFYVNGNELSISEKHSDGSGDTKKYNIGQLGG
ncbi:tetratricopeptide repeat protein [Shewanella putrefaciens]|uniref:tetratricopeptide repeat protein n=1 Tax=Shewanella putrefaciens TaxID=24 RepID=UPI003D7B8B66